MVPKVQGWELGEWLLRDRRELRPCERVVQGRVHQGL